MEDANSAFDVAGAEVLGRPAISKCYQCGKCTAGCPVASRMEIVPNQIIRLLQLGRDDIALSNSSIWRCVSCLTCSARCPKLVDCAAMMDALRERSLQLGKVASEAETTVSFQKAFLNNIRQNGRLDELQLIARFKTEVAFRTLRPAVLFKDAALAPQLRKRKKLHLSAGRVADRELVGRIYARCASSPPQDKMPAEAAAESSEK